MLSLPCKKWLVGMKLKSTSRYPIEEIRRLVLFGFGDIDHKNVAVNVKNSRYAYAGRCYFVVPCMSPVEADHLVVIRIGSPDKFPADNMVESVSWKRLKPGDKYENLQVRSKMKRIGGVEERWFEKRTTTKHPYGGKSSPLVEFADWKESMVGLAAHEAMHLQQFRSDSPKSEVECERYALARLKAYRDLPSH